MAKSRKKKKGSSLTPKKSKSPVFACTRYPRCPRRSEIESHVIEEADEEEGFGPMYSSRSVAVRGPCKVRCHDRHYKGSPNHSVILLLPGGIAVDIGS